MFHTPSRKKSTSSFSTMSSTNSHQQMLFSQSVPDTGSNTGEYRILCVGQKQMTPCHCRQLLKKQSSNSFEIPDTWRPSIMQCLKRETDEERRLHLGVTRLLETWFPKCLRWIQNQILRLPLW